MVQLAPASENHHHKSPGGLLLHTYESALFALKRRKGIQLPIGGTIDKIHREKHLWSYALFCACVLHDVGKPMGSMAMMATFSDGEERRWYPHEPPLTEMSAYSYRIEFLADSVAYSYHHRMSMTLFHLIPGRARIWLASHSEVMKQLTCYLWGDRYESDIIGDLAEFGDRQSTANNLQIPAEGVPSFSDRFSLIDRLLTAARELIGTSDMPINRNGATGWVSEDGETIYVVCRTFVEKLVKRLREQEFHQVPSDPVRLYDILMEHGYAIAHDGKAVHTISVKGNDFQHAFTCLKFKTRLFFPPTKLPLAFEGHIEEGVIKDNTPGKDQAVNAMENVKRPSSEKQDDGASAVVDVETEETGRVTNGENEGDKGGKAEEVVDTVKSDVSHETEAIPKDTVGEAEEKREEPVEEAAKTIKESENTEVTGVALRQEMTLTDPQLGKHFFNWLKKNLIEKTILINNVNAVVHIVPEGVFVLAPRAFMEFLERHDMDPTQHKKVSRRFQSLRINVKRNDMNIHKYWVASKNRKTNINGWLIPFDKIYEHGAKPPSPNKYFEINKD